MWSITRHSLTRRVQGARPPLKGRGRSLRLALLSPLQREADDFFEALEGKIWDILFSCWVTSVNLPLTLRSFTNLDAVSPGFTPRSEVECPLLLFLQNATIQDVKARVAFSPMPLIWMKPVT